jgi:FlaG/FlaF family flagellin (archaellin)
MSSLNAISPEEGDSRGVTPAMTVGLLVVITVVLSIVIMTGVFFISDEVDESPPQAIIEVEYDSDGTATIAHRGGEAIPGESVRVTGPVAEQNPFEDEMFTAGDRVTVELVDSGSATVVWQSDDSDTSTVLRQFDISAENAPAQGDWTALRTKLENDENITLQHDYTPNSPNYNKEVGSGSWVPIDYNGVLDGNGHELRGIDINEPMGSKVGFIDTLGGEVKNLDVIGPTITGKEKIGFIGKNNNGGTVSNISVKDATVNSTADSFSNAGILIGENYGKVRSASVTGSVTSDGNNVGGLAGYNAGTIEDSSASGTVEGEKNIGGLVGQNSPSPGLISGSSAQVDVTGDYRVGGFVGTQQGSSGATIEESYATGTVTGTNKGSSFGPGAVGGFIGVNNPDSSISKSYATSTVDAPNGSNVGGFAGSNAGTVETSYATGDVTGNDSVGGFAGENGKLVSGVYATGSVTGSANTSGLVGRLRGSSFRDGVLRDSYFDNTSTGTGQTDAVGVIAPFGNTAEKRGEVSGLDTTEMQDVSASSNMGAFDFNSAWDTTGDYPVLQALDEQTQLDARD